jgi:YVTN family beta-propeller protein
VATLITIALAGGILAVPVTAANAGALPYTARVTPEASLTAANSITSAGGHLFVADTNAVLVFNAAGGLETTIASVFGATSITAAPDGATVYVAESSSAKIATIDVATLTKTAEVTVSACPSSLAVTATTVFYSSGCATVGSINHVDRGTGTAHDLATPDVTGIYDAPVLKTDGTTLYSLEYFGDLNAWPLTGSTLGTVVNGPSGIQQTPDWAVGGGRIVITNMNIYGYTMFDASTLSKVADLPAAAYPRTVAVTPNGATIVGGLQNGDVFWTFNAATAAATGQTPLAAANTNVWPAGGGVAFSADGSIAYMIGKEWTGDGVYHYSLIAASLGAHSSTSVSVAVTQALRYGAATTVTVTGTPNMTADVAVTSDGATTHYNVALGATGRSALKLVKPYSGTITATVPGDFTHTGYLSNAVAYRIPSAMSVAMTKGHKTIRGIVYYAKASYAKQAVRILAPAVGRTVTAILWRASGSRWIKRQVATLRTTSAGYVFTYLVSATKGVSYKITYSFRGDTFNGGNTGTTRVFRIG